MPFSDSKSRPVPNRKKFAPCPIANSCDKLHKMFYAMGILLDYNTYKVRLSLYCFSLSSPVTFVRHCSVVQFPSSCFFLYPSCSIHWFSVILFRSQLSRTGDYVVRLYHWLPIRRPVEFKIASLVYQVPTYRADDVHLASESSARSLSSYSGRKCSVTRVQSIFGEICFAAAGPRIWNNLPASLRDKEVSCTEFRRQLRTFMFQTDCGASWLFWLLRLINISTRVLTYLLTYLLTY